jgi:poly-gamma-glutamate capsule biosynthesis protein CapA/YwtB (metallophosphatase superfamily)
MTGRGIDQVMPHPSDPEIHEGVMDSAIGYVRLSERLHGALERPVPFDYVWGDALHALARAAPDARVINLETSVTTSPDWMPKGINYRMHPSNVPCLTEAGIQCCVLANNHVLDWGRDGLTETLDVLGRAGICTAGAGRDLARACAPAVIELGEANRVVVLALGTESSGIPTDWGATPTRSGVNLLQDLSDRSVAEIARQVQAFKRPGDVLVVSLHWGGNWGYEVPASHQHFARELIDRAGVDIVHGHSSHHPQAVEVYRGHLILYGAGDFLNDYEGIGGHRQFRGELSLMYFAEVEIGSGRLLALRMTPMRMRRFRLERASQGDAEWLRDMLARESAAFGLDVELAPDSDQRHSELLLQGFA